MTEIEPPIGAAEISRRLAVRGLIAARDQPPGRRREGD